MRIVFLSHTARVSGAERAMLELLGGLPADVEPTIASPEGPLADAARELGLTVAAIPAAEGSLRIHPIHTTAGLAGIARAGFDLARIARRAGAHTVHANSVRAGLVADLSRRLGGPPSVVFVQDCLPRSRLGDLSRRAILGSGAAVLANSDHVAANFAAGRKADIRTVYNGMLDEGGRLIGARGAETIAGRESEGAPLVGVVAQITPWKGQDTAIEALALLRRRHPGARLLLVGEAKFVAPSSRHDNRSYRGRLEGMVRSLGLGGAVEFLGEREDALAIIAGLDVLLAPSWEEPFGRTIVEAMALGTPVVATSVGGPPEFIADGRSGVLVPPRDATRLADAVDALASDPALRERVSAGAREAASRFTLERHVAAVMAAHRAVIAGSDPARGPGFTG